MKSTQSTKSLWSIVRIDDGFHELVKTLIIKQNNIYNNYQRVEPIRAIEHQQVIDLTKIE